MIFLRLVYIVMPASVLMAFLWSPPVQGLGGTGRIVFFHVPSAMVSVIAFVVAGVLSAARLAGKEEAARGREEAAHDSAVIGTVFTLITVVTGSLWAKASWGSFWNWDPRETSILLLLLVYAAYFSLYAGLEHNENRGRIAAVYLIFAMAVMPFFVFIVPRIRDSLHPMTIINPERKIQMEFSMKVTLITTVTAFTFLYMYLLTLMKRIRNFEHKIEEKYDI